MRLKLTNEQLDIASKLKDVFGLTPPECEDTWGPYIDLTRSLAYIISACKGLPLPEDMRKAFDTAWKAYVQLWGNEHNRVLMDILGGEEGLDAVRNHDKGHAIINKLLGRVREKCGGKIQPGMDVSGIDFSDILQELS